MSLTLEELILIRDELERHALDTDSGDHAYDLVEQAIGRASVTVEERTRWLLTEASLQAKDHPSKDARWFAQSVVNYFGRDRLCKPKPILGWLIEGFGSDGFNSFTLATHNRSTVATCDKRYHRVTQLVADEQEYQWPN